MQLESVECMVSNTSFDGEVPNEMESPCQETVQVSITSLGVATNPSETNMQLESVGCSLSNTSCDREVSDEMENPCKKKTQVSITSLDVATNSSETQMSMLEVSFLRKSPSTTG